MTQLGLFDDCPLTEAEVVRLAEVLMRQHGLIDKGWTFGFDHAYTILGQCDNRHKRITLSRHFVKTNPESSIVETVKHEIAHALSHSSGHGEEWKAVARRIGAVPQRAGAETVVMPEGRYVAVCETCGKVSRRHRMPRLQVTCGRCDRHFNERYLLTFRKAL